MRADYAGGVLRIVALVSGGGSNLEALLDHLDRSNTDAKVVAIGSDLDAPGLSHGTKRGIPTFVVPFHSTPDREAWGEELIAAIEQHQPDLVVLSGFMRLVPANVVARFAPHLLNTHPAFLPEFPGAHAVRDAMAAGVTESGASLIVVDESVDGGPLVSQVRVPVQPGDTESTLHERIKTAERTLLANAIDAIAEGSLDLKELVTR